MHAKPKIGSLGVKLRQFQMEAIDSMFRHNRGMILLPTGTGKSFIQAYTIIRSIKERAEASLSPKAYVILSHRILLSMQLMKEVFIQMNDNGINARYLNVCSGKVNEDDFFQILKRLEAPVDFYSNINSTLSIDDIGQRTVQAIDGGLPMILSGTYHSAEKIAKAGVPVEIVFNDECHFLTSPEFKDVHFMIESAKSFYFTATRRDSESNSGLGMNNRKLFGEVIYRKSPLQMILAGEIAMPMMHMVKFDLHGSEYQDGNYESQAYCITQSFLKHSEIVDQMSKDRTDLVGAKLLVTCEGQDALLNIMKSKKMGSFLESNPDVKIFAISSEVGAFIDGIHRPPSGNLVYGFLNTIRSLSPSDKAIILHVDMLAEGLDVPGITGVMPFRNSSPAKFTQTLGRACRIHPHDRKRIYSGEIKAADFESYVKPYAWVVLPLFMSYSADMRERYLSIMTEIKANYEYTPSDMLLISNSAGIGDVPELLPISDILEGRKHFGTSIKEFFHHVENMDIINKLFKDSKLFNRMSVDERSSALRGFVI